MANSDFTIGVVSSPDCPTLHRVCKYALALKSEYALNKSIFLFTFHYLQDAENITITCDGVSRPILAIRLDEFCTSPSALFVQYFLPLVILVLLILIGIILCLYYKKPVSYTHLTLPTKA